MDAIWAQRGEKYRAVIDMYEEFVSKTDKKVQLIWVEYELAAGQFIANMHIYYCPKCCMEFALKGGGLLEPNGKNVYNSS